MSNQIAELKELVTAMETHLKNKGVISIKDETDEVVTNSDRLLKGILEAVSAKGEKDDALDILTAKLDSLCQQLASIDEKTKPADVTQVVKSLGKLERLMADFSKKKLETKVEVKAPEPIVKTEIIQESKKLDELINAVEALTREIKSQGEELETIKQKSFVLNRKAGDAIPVQLVDKSGRRFQDLTDIKGMGGTSSIAVASGGGSGIGTPFNVYAEDTDVPSITETTILTYSVTSDIPTYIGGAIVSCGSAVKFKLKVNGVTKAVGRTTEGHPTENLSFGNGAIRVRSGDSVTITAYHIEDSSQTVDANLYGTI